MSWIDIQDRKPVNEQEIIVYSKFNLTIRGKVMEYEYHCSAIYDSETDTYLDRYHHLIPEVKLWHELPEKPTIKYLNPNSKEKSNG